MITRLLVFHYTSIITFDQCLVTNGAVAIADQILLSTEKRRTNSGSTARKTIVILVKLQSFAAKCCKIRKILPCEVFQVLYIFVLRSHSHTFEPKLAEKWYAFPTHNTNICKLCEFVMQGYTFRILQHQTVHFY